MKRAAVIGMGVIYHIHLAAIENNPEIELVGVCDIDESKKEEAPEGVPFYTSYREMIQETKPDVVHICLPHYLHVPVAEEVADMGVHVFCEKPVALNTAQGQAFAQFEELHPERHMGICLQNRCNATIEALKQLIDSGRYGKVTAVKGVVLWNREKDYYDSKPWRGKWETAGGGCMINQSIHTLDLMYYLGGKIDRVTASVSQLLDYGIEVEDTVSACFQYANGARGFFTATNANYKNEDVQIAVQMEKAEFVIDHYILYRVDENEERERITEDATLPGTKFYYGAGHRIAISRFYRALEEENQNYIHVRDAVMSIRIVDAIQESGKTGKPVKII